MKQEEAVLLILWFFRVAVQFILFVSSSSPDALPQSRVVFQTSGKLEEIFFSELKKKKTRKAFSVMLNLQFRHIIHAAMECHLIIECNLLCYKWKAVSDIIMDTWVRFMSLRQKKNRVV